MLQKAPAAHGQEGAYESSFQEAKAVPQLQVYRDIALNSGPSDIRFATFANF